MKTYVIDIDGTLADLTHRLHLIDRQRPGGPDWDAFYQACSEDSPIQPVIEVVQALGWRDSIDVDIIYLTGRTESVRDRTLAWLSRNTLPMGQLLMRADGDHRPDTVTKREQLARLIERDCEIAACFEDRPSVCRMMRELGLTVFQVGSGEEF